MRASLAAWGPGARSSARWGLGAKPLVALVVGDQGSSRVFQCRNSSSNGNLHTQDLKFETLLQTKRRQYNRTQIHFKEKWASCLSSDFASFCSNYIPKICAMILPDFLQIRPMFLHFPRGEGVGVMPKWDIMLHISCVKSIHLGATSMCILHVKFLSYPHPTQIIVIMGNLQLINENILGPLLKG